MLTHLAFSVLLVLFSSGCVMFNSVDIADLFDDKVKLKHVGGDKDAKDKIAILPLHGVITGTQQRFSMSSGISPASVEKMLAALRTQEGIKAVVLDINSPGGSAAASEEIMSQLIRFKSEKNIPMVAYYGDMAASGGYYISQAADQIVANPNAVTGSIGVVLMFPRLDKFLKNKLDIEMITFKSGKFKDSGSAFRAMSKEERQHWEKLTLMYYDRFVEVVARMRKLPEEQVRKISQGQVMHPKSALENRLIDQIGTMDVAIAAAKKAAGGNDNEYSQLRVTSIAPPQIVPQNVDVNLPFGLSQAQSPAWNQRGAVLYLW